MTTKDDALRLALAALETCTPGDYSTGHVMNPWYDELGVEKAITACREALAQKDEQEKEPVAWMLECPTMTGDTGWILSWSRIGAGLCNRLQGEEHEKPLYTAPPPRQPLTDEEVQDKWEHITGHSIFGGDLSEGRAMYISPNEVMEFASAIEAAHGIGAEHDKR